ncbi:MAG TPA: Lrp/AsnC family transcriptional regulator [Lysinibacillus sp.]|jgi:Lrp/AsnC family leucine-responsive transcriptional regulator|uniref:Lrp/AsnC family transcriptional regulator n=1 Tax=Lysinibacillus fusiformis TaxID=28031 RepID=A0A2I0UUT2_9BACI|nr:MULTISPECIES: Lrp/AsnC family transcriptional regulator [Lysinibacillus]HBT72554.1 Lrp/AsnC family transcriptional regulator [Lysinibacillus sp.]KUF27779.1 AsnC family transcriptional regulator [Lysinibacillus sp. F5]MEE3808003.1 Lrp/AsnC family transcriptional regulator [Lysinibacillus fusiformis]PKU49799.1 Lrp/AsnC family transcriptional regulator [Lysinibacillus fusiformis]WCH47603.1 Lrp/AsnC family transcriptional regulator [Lysinibacillus sp. OF-1]
MDFINERILKELKEDSRISMSELGRRVHLSAPAVRERVRQLEEQEVIKKYTLAINKKALGYPVEAIIEATIKNNRYADFKDLIKTYTTIDFCYRISGEACFLLKGHFQTFSDVEQFIDVLQPYAHTKTNFIFSDICEDI